MRTVSVLGSPAEVAREAAELFVARAAEAVAVRGAFRVALAGGTTPRALYRALAEGGDPPYRDRVDWTRTWLFTGDERGVPPAHADSNYRMAWETLLSKVPVPPGHVVRFWSEGDDPDVVVRHFESMVRDLFGLAAPAIPRFDLVLLGLGTDGHVASLFPGSPLLSERERVAGTALAPASGQRRYTITPAVIEAARCVLFLACGREKAGMVREVFEGERRPERVPAQLAWPIEGDVAWLVDREAGELLATRT